MRLEVRLPHRAREDGEPRRAVTSVNVRREEKLLFDHLHSWWRLQDGAALSQVDAFSRVLALALENPRSNAPPELRGKK
jgi:hypothetical protein